MSRKRSTRSLWVLTTGAVLSAAALGAPTGTGGGGYAGDAAGRSSGGDGGGFWAGASWPGLSALTQSHGSSPVALAPGAAPPGEAAPAAPATPESLWPADAQAPTGGLDGVDSLDGLAASGWDDSVSTESARVVPAGLSGSGIPDAALAAYARAESALDRLDPGCRLDWSLLAAIGRVESDHGRYGGATLRRDGRSVPGIIGLRLDGTGETARIADTDAGRLDGDREFDRAVGPMQFLPGTWTELAVDGDRDGAENPQDIDDAALAAGYYLCARGADLSGTTGRAGAVFRYNRSSAYVEQVLALADRYRTGTTDNELPTTRELPEVPRFRGDVPSGPASPADAPAGSGAGTTRPGPQLPDSGQTRTPSRGRGGTADTGRPRKTDPSRKAGDGVDKKKPEKPRTPPLKPRTPPPPPPNLGPCAEDEPNDRAAQATAFQRSGACATTAKGTIGRPGDADWFALPWRDDAVQLTLTVPAGKSYGLQVTAPDGTTTTARPGTTTRVTLPKGSAGTVRARVTGVGSGSSSFGSSAVYTLSAEKPRTPETPKPPVRPACAEDEPNDSAAKATAFSGSCATVRRGRVATAGDVDWFRLPWQAKGLRLTLQMPAGTTGTDYGVSVYGAKGKLTGKISGTGAQRMLVLRDLSAGSPLSIRVDAGPGRVASTAWYTLTAAEPDADTTGKPQSPSCPEDEPNDTVAGATPLSGSCATMRRGRVDKAGDVDYYRMPLAAGTRGEVRLTPPTGRRVTMLVTDPAGKQVRPTVTGGTATAKLAALPRAGAYLVEVTGSSPSASGWYTLLADRQQAAGTGGATGQTGTAKPTTKPTTKPAVCTPERGAESEPNDAAAQATAFRTGCGGTRTGLLRTAGDVDWFVLPGSWPGTSVRVTLTVPAGENYDLKVVGPGGAKTSARGTGKAETVTLTLPKGSAVPVRIAVTGAAGSFSPTARYTLAVAKP